MLYLFILLLPVIGFVALLTYKQTSLILPARVNSVDTPPASLNPEYLSLKTPDGNTLHGVLFASKNTSPTTLILAFPGNMHNAVGFATYLKNNVFPEQDVAIAALSYRGYPNGITPPSTGTPSQKAMFEDGLFIYDTLFQRLHPAVVKIVGYSIGTAVSNHIALHRPVESMALLAPIASIRRIAQDKYPWIPVRLLLRHPFATEDTIGALQTSTTIIYSHTDGLVPAAHVEQVLHNANPNIPIINVPDTNHVTLILSDKLPGLIRTALGFKP
jgi:pimeloyl-ACP methyl ester carboxylesterase